MSNIESKMNSYEIEHLARIRKSLAECTVLLKKNGAFPLDAPCKIGAFGSGVRYTVKGGTGSGEVNSRYFINIEDGLKKAGFEVFGHVWANMYKYYLDKEKKEFQRSIKERARKEKMNIVAASMGAVMKAPEYDIRPNLKCDAAIYVVSRISGEGNDRLPEKGDFKLTDSEIKDILELDKNYDKFMLVINTGGPVDLSPVMEVGNILVLSQLGVETGSALADILLGKSYPSGKLATTWTAIEDYSTAGDFGLRDDVRYREGIYVGYRYFDAFNLEPLFPFGFGLGYTDFEIKTGKSPISITGSSVSVTAKVSNIGGFKGKEVPQVYVSCPSGKLDREVKSLAGFVKTKELEPGESEKVSISFDMKYLAAFDEEAGCWIFEKGDYIILIGNSSDSVRPCGIITLNDDITAGETVGNFDNINLSDFTDVKNVFGRDFETKGVQKISINAEALTGILSPVGTKTDETHDITHLNAFTSDELSYMNVGHYNDGTIIESVIGEASSSVAGAAGESTSKFEALGIPKIVMADGPAGIRISREYYEDKKGKHGLSSGIPESMQDLVPRPLRKFMTDKKPPKGASIKTQYCTAIPIGTAIAQSFNVDFAEELGDIVGSEAELFGVNLWLAPALNIHRSVLCGRNFEYYSEDPLVSGKMAAAITRGVQSHKGVGVTIKHFAANNQETNRYATNSMISERALREIYLRGFEICVKKSDPMAIMTSYNLLGGEHTSESCTLTTEILRDEWGFDGLVMTDWVVGGDFLIMKGSKYGTPDPAKVAAAGCSLFMPGSKGDVKAVQKGIANGTVTKAQLVENVGWLMHVADRLGLVK